MFKIEQVSAENDNGHFKIYSVLHPNHLIALNRNDCDSANKEIYLKHKHDSDGSGDSNDLVNSDSAKWIIKSNGAIENVHCSGMVISFSTSIGDLTIRSNKETDGWVQVRDS